MVVSPRRRWSYIVGGIDMGWGVQHTPFYVPDPRDPYDLSETAVSHALWSGAIYGAAWAYSGIPPGPGHFTTMHYAFTSRQHVGAAYAGTNAFDDTMYALSVYSKPFRTAARVAAKVAVPLGLADVAYDVVTNPTDNYITRAWYASPTAFLFGDHYWQQHGIKEGTRVAFSEMGKNFGFD